MLRGWCVGRLKLSSSEVGSLLFFSPKFCVETLPCAHSKQAFQYFLHYYSKRRNDAWVAAVWLSL